ncbi:hypothetical protein [Halobaculum sp. MBLA0143]|uniref:hypothetical protein n=1 Tax=Halobaculum sp. MBLA0143 TaxID=3079933 RepID=UPI0035245739
MTLLLPTRVVQQDRPHHADEVRVGEHATPPSDVPNPPIKIKRDLPRRPRAELVEPFEDTFIR